MHQLLNDPVDVIVSFSDNRVRPKKLRWDQREYEIKQVNLIHTATEGAKRLFFFSVSDETNFFKLRLDTELLEWRLVELYTE
ncbi:hypothetical protein KJ611_00720 [Patescibacteria group bacterium]|nr:hypothetical protein [Patescibacteria group bacterium]MBU1705577.1 hypothetical protein [Patescibacteria group bacterium]